MNLKKKGNLLPLYFAIMIFGIISVLVITLGYFYFAVGNDYLVLPLYNGSQTTNYSDTINQGFENTIGNYQGTNLSFIDNFWFLAYLMISIAGLVAAYTSRNTHYFSWSNMLFSGTMIILFIVGLFSTLINWFYFDILLNLFNNMAVNVPKFAFYVENYGFIFFLQMMAMLLINVIDFDYAKLLQRKKKEKETLDLEDEIL